MTRYQGNVANVLILPGIEEAMTRQGDAIDRLVQSSTSPALANFLRAFKVADVCARLRGSDVDTVAAMEAVAALPSLAQAIVVELTDCLSYFRAITKESQT